MARHHTLAPVYESARAVGCADWETEALELAREAARIPVEGSGVDVAGLCHGAAGLAHVFNRLFQASGDEVFATAARSWFAHTLSLRHPGQGIGGYLSRRGRNHPWVANPGMLEGASGVALALLAALSSREPAWDRALLMSLRR